mgnify:CR=1 FL=1
MSKKTTRHDHEDLDREDTKRKRLSLDLLFNGKELEEKLSPLSYLCSNEFMKEARFFWTHVNIYLSNYLNSTLEYLITEQHLMLRT